MTIFCPYCHSPALMVTGARLYPHRPDLTHKKFWRCDPCDAHVGCHEPNKQHGFNGTEPLGRLANSELRHEKHQAHRWFDPLWKSGLMRRKQAYKWLARELGISEANCHIGMFDVDGCKAVVAAVKNYRERKAA